jgi:hypothetical protein
MANSLLDLPFVGETRRNHALEHATLHVLAAKHPGSPLAGHSNPTGFFILGKVSADEVQSAAAEALSRLRLGERELAIHPGCGTNFATSALVAGTMAWFVLRGARSGWGRMARLPFAIAFALLGLALSRPLGPLLQQRITTDADMGDLQLVEVRPGKGRHVTAHRVITRA